MRIPYSITPGGISLLVDYRPRQVPSTSPNYQALVEALRKPEHDLEQIKVLADLVRFIALKSFDAVQISNDEVRYNGQKVHNVVADRLLELVQAGHDAEPLARFLNRLMANPLESAREELYLWLEAGKMPFTDDGCFLAFKAVRPNYTDKHSGTFDNSVGQVVSMPREQVDPDRYNECSRGLHFCSPGYLPNFASYGDPIMIVKIDPADVVAIPRDYNNQKGRTWRYEVVGEVPPEEAAEQFFGGKPLVNSYSSQEVGNDLPEEENHEEEITASEPADAHTAPVAGGTNGSQDNGADTPAISAKGKQMAVSTTKSGSLKFSTKDGQTFTAAQVRKAIKTHGGVRPAARALGVAKSTFQGWAALV